MVIGRVRLGSKDIPFGFAQRNVVEGFMPTFTLDRLENAKVSSSAKIYQSGRVMEEGCFRRLERREKRIEGGGSSTSLNELI